VGVEETRAAEEIDGIEVLLRVESTVADPAPVELAVGAHDVVWFILFLGYPLSAFRALPSEPVFNALISFVIIYHSDLLGDLRLMHVPVDLPLLEDVVYVDKLLRVWSNHRILILYEDRLMIRLNVAGFFVVDLVWSDMAHVCRSQPRK